MGEGQEDLRIPAWSVVASSRTKSGWRRGFPRPRPCPRNPPKQPECVRLPKACRGQSLAPTRRALERGWGGARPA